MIFIALSLVYFLTVTTDRLGLSMNLDLLYYVIKATIYKQQCYCHLSLSIGFFCYKNI